MRLSSAAILSILLAPAALIPILLGSAGAALAKDYYVVPPGTVQSCTSDGSQTCPWIGLGALSPTTITGGDRLLLLDGNYGGLKLYQIAFASPVVVQSLNGKNAHFDWINIVDGTKNVTFRNLSVWPSDPSLRVSPLVTANTKASNIIVDGLDVRGVQASADYMNWSLTDWQAYAPTGADLFSPDSIIQNSTFQGIYIGAAVEGANSSLIGNRVDGFAGDAYRILADNDVASGNYSQNCFQIDGNHTDGIQSWADADGVISGLTIEKNTFIEWNSTAVNALHCSMEGVGFFDGPYQNILIRNNVISVTQYHGISVYGGMNVQILNNTVVNNKNIEGIAPWIGIFNNKNGTLAQNVLVANNLEMSIHSEVTATAATFVNNSSLMGLNALFENIATFDYRPTTASGFIDTGDAANAPPTDILGASRPYGAGPDRGAYEINGTGGTTTGGTTTGGTTTGGTTGSPPPWSAKFLKPPKKS